MSSLTSLLQEDAEQSMPPYELWLRGRDEILRWWFGPGIGCKGSRLIPVAATAGPPAGQYRRSPDGTATTPGRSRSSSWVRAGS